LKLAVLHDVAGRTPQPKTVAAASPGGAGAHETYISIQLLRGLAAMLVVVFHAGVMVRDRFPAAGDHFLLLSGAAGVDIFFPISGFVMLISSRALLLRPDGWKIFAERRLIRIVPLYWLATTLKVLAVLAVPALALHSQLGEWHILASYLFIADRNAMGTVEPVLPVGWTLNYEMFFYLIFAVALLWRRPLIITVSAILLLIVAVGGVVPKDIAAFTVFRPLVLEFGAGLWIAQLAWDGVRLRRRTAIACFIIALLALLATDALPSAEVESARLLLWGLPGAMLVLAAVSLEPWVAKRRWRIASVLGDASYSIYLSHGFVLPCFAVAAAKMGFHGIIGATASFGLSIVVSALFGIAIYRWIERPMTRALLRWRKARTVVATTAG
jgi:peptidoglycan/LPS O-acetylase OafA/YrhL